MKTLIFVRHAQAEPATPSKVDAERSLSELGQQEALTTAEKLKTNKIIPDKIFSSPAVRAYHTARIIAEKVGYKKDLIAVEDILYSDYGLFDIKLLLETVAKTCDKVMFVAHNPYMEELAQLLCYGFYKTFTCGTITIMEFDIKEWKEMRTSSGKLTMYEKPC